MTIIRKELNSLDRNRKNQTAWCVNCDEVFDNRLDSKIHEENYKHKIKVVEFWTISRR